MGAPPVDWEQKKAASAGYQPISYQQYRQQQAPQAQQAPPPAGQSAPLAPSRQPPQPPAGYAQSPPQAYGQYPPGQYAPAPQPVPAQPGQYGAPPPQYQAQQYPPQQYPPKQYPPQYQYQYQRPQGAQYPQYSAPPPAGSYQYGAGQPGYPPYPGAPPGPPPSMMKQPGGILALVGFICGLGAMVSVLIGNLVFTASAPIPCLIVGLIAGIIGTALGVAAWAKGNKGAKGIAIFSVVWAVASVIIGLMWATLLH